MRTPGDVLAAVVWVLCLSTLCRCLVRHIILNRMDIPLGLHVVTSSVIYVLCVPCFDGASFAFLVHTYNAGLAILDRERCSTKVEAHVPVLVRALPDAHPGWSDPSGVNNKHFNTMDIEAEYMESIKS